MTDPTPVVTCVTRRLVPYFVYISSTLHVENFMGNKFVARLVVEARLVVDARLDCLNFPAYACEGNVLVFGG